MIEINIAAGSVAIRRAPVALDLMKGAQQKWPCLDARPKILIAPRPEIPRDRWRFMLALVIIALAGELAVLWAW